jgi:beta-N-acetylhexosaminidase
MRASARLAGQCLMIGFEGLEPSAEVRELIRDHGVGAMILFGRNVAEPAQLAGLVRELQEIARGAGHETPLLVGVDQEGGRVARLAGAWDEWPALRVLGRAGSEDLARRFGAALAEQLLPCGIHINFAPVVDVDTNPANPVIGDRSFGDDPVLVGRLGAALIQGMQAAGVAASAKHFPGHGDTAVDSHLDLPTVEHSRSRLEDVELRPFRAAVTAGVATVMTAHILVREIDDALPATLSPRLVRDVLRTEMRFDGVVVSDDLEMKAIATHWRPGRAAALAFEAGCDLLLVCRGADAQAEAHEALVKTTESDPLALKKLEDAALRVRRLKERYIPGRREADARAAVEAASRASHRELALEIGERGGLRA